MYLELLPCIKLIYNKAAMNASETPYFHRQKQNYEVVALMAVSTMALLKFKYK